MFIKANTLASRGIEIVDSDFTQVYHWDGDRYFLPDDPNAKVGDPMLDAYERRGYDEEYIARNIALIACWAAKDIRNKQGWSAADFYRAACKGTQYDKYRSEIEKLLLLA